MCQKVISVQTRPWDEGGKTTRLRLKHRTEDSKEPGICPGNCVLYSVLGSFSGALFFFNSNFYSNSRNMDISSSSGVFPGENKSSTDKGASQSWKHNNIQAFAKNSLLQLKAWPYPGGNIFLERAARLQEGTLELALKNVLLLSSLTSGTVPPNAKKFHLMMNLLPAACALDKRCLLLQGAQGQVRVLVLSTETSLMVVLLSSFCFIL